MSSSERRSLLIAGAGAAAAALLAGCGFELRRAPVMPFETIALTGFPPRSPLAEELKRQIQISARVVEPSAQPQVVLQAISDERTRSVVASTSAAQVREFQLKLKFNFSARTAGGRELIAPVELLQTRDLSYSETLALAKQQEENDLYREMQTDVVLQVMRRLAAIKLG